jgi:hypothetical protein
MIATDDYCWPSKLRASENISEAQSILSLGRIINEKTGKYM